MTCRSVGTDTVLQAWRIRRKKWEGGKLYVYDTHVQIVFLSILSYVRFLFNVVLFVVCFCYCVVFPFLVWFCFRLFPSLNPTLVCYFFFFVPMLIVSHRSLSRSKGKVSVHACFNLISFLSLSFFFSFFSVSVSLSLKKLLFFFLLFIYFIPFYLLNFINFFKRILAQHNTQCTSLHSLPRSNHVELPCSLLSLHLACVF